MTVLRQTRGIESGPRRRRLDRSAPLRLGRALLRVLPKGQLLPDRSWNQRHRWIVVLVALHAIALAAFGAARGYGIAHSILEASVVAIAAAAAMLPLGRSLRSVSTSVGLVTSSALLVHFWDGQIEAHFLFFFVVAVLTLYQDWLPFLVAIGYVVLHHGALGALDAGSVYNHSGATAHPWQWALIHGGFVLAASAANVVAWRVNEHLLHEPLTGLPSRPVFLHSVERALSRARRRRELIAVLFVDLDRFKVLNDSLGHAAGDRLLAEVARRVVRATRDRDVVARIGGDEFAVLCQDVRSEEEAIAVAERIEAELRQPLLLGRTPVTPTASIGVAVSRREARSAEELLADADLAMYRAKDERGGSVVLLGEDMRRRDLQRLETETALGTALERNELRLEYQPIVTLGEGEIVGAEALLRWEHPARGLLGPAGFIDVAEQSGLIVPIGHWVLSEACREAASWPTRGSAEPFVTVNVSHRQLMDPGLVDAVARALERSGLSPGRLAIELTETAVLEGDDAPVETLDAIRRLGVRIMLDDFGTGHASLSSLDRLPIETLKIDRSFVGRLGPEAGDSSLVSAIASMARALGVSVIAEGVETEAQVRTLRLLGLALAQGFHFGRPCPPEQLRAQLASPGAPDMLGRSATP